MMNYVHVAMRFGVKFIRLISFMLMERVGLVIHSGVAFTVADYKFCCRATRCTPGIDPLHILGKDRAPLQSD